MEEEEEAEVEAEAEIETKTVNASKVVTLRIDISPLQSKLTQTQNSRPSSGHFVSLEMHLPTQSPQSTSWPRSHV